jgi:hypothetical protein
MCIALHLCKGGLHMESFICAFATIRLERMFIEVILLFREYYLIIIFFEL